MSNSNSEPLSLIDDYLPIPPVLGSRIQHRRPGKRSGLGKHSVCRYLPRGGWKDLEDNIERDLKYRWTLLGKREGKTVVDVPSLRACYETQVCQHFTIYRLPLALAIRLRESLMKYNSTSDFSLFLWTRRCSPMDVRAFIRSRSVTPSRLGEKLIRFNCKELLSSMRKAGRI